MSPGTSMNNDNKFRCNCKSVCLWEFREFLHFSPKCRSTWGCWYIMKKPFHEFRKRIHISLHWGMRHVTEAIVIHMKRLLFFFLHFSWSLFFCVGLQGNGKYLELWDISVIFLVMAMAFLLLVCYFITALGGSQYN